MIKEAIDKVVRGLDLDQDAMVAVMNEIMGGEAEPAQIASFLTALRMKGETVDEITGAVRVMREKSTKINAGEGIIVDTCGTGGDKSNTFNISTAAAFVVATTGLTVAKHGNRSVSSKSGSADVLKELGVNIEAKKEVVENAISEINIGFLFAPMLHSAMKYAGPVRSQIGIRTIFNILGPMTNPANAKRQVLGVYDLELTDIMAKVLANFDTEHAFIVAGEDGLDEITLTDLTKISELKDGQIKTYHISPEDLGFEKCKKEDLIGGDATVNAKIIKDIFDGTIKDAKRNIVVVNAAAAIVAGGKANSLKEGVAIASHAIDSGEAKIKLNELIRLTN